MSDLSLPPLTLLPLPEEGKAGASAAGREEPFGWPTPPLPSFPAPTPWTESAPCEIEGLNGSVMRVRLINFDPIAGIAQIQSPPARTTMPLRFPQFRRLSLTTPLQPLPTPLALEATGNAALDSRPPVPYRLKMTTGPLAEGKTVGHVVTDYGLFLFEPVDDQGAVRRVFVPRHAFEAYEIGELIGQVLVAQKVVTPQQVELTAQEQSDLRRQRVGDILVSKEVVTSEQLEAAIAQQASMPMVRMGEALMALGFINQEQLDEALEQQRTDRGVPLGELLVRKGLISRQELQTALARKMGYPVVDLAQYTPETDALSRVAYTVANRLQVLPLMLRGGRLVVALEDPTRAKALDEIEFAAGCKVVPALTQVGSLGSALDNAYQKMGAEVWANKVAAAEAADGELPDANELLLSLEQHSDEPSDNEPSIEQSDNSLVRLINQMILEAQAQGVSDIHIECQPGREKVRIRFRRDGVLKPYLELPHTYRSAMLARIKIMCDLDISERRKPQDGKIAFGKYHNGSRLELRVATIPTAGGLEDAVLRLLASAKPMPLDDIGLAPRNLSQIKEMIQRPYGMFLCVGPTGSGKTTTLHSAMGFINVPERKIWTAEDPVEITQPGLRQVQVNPKIDWTFARALRAFLRADPDVIMVGEIRDGETATMAVESSLTGHLVMSTLHTNSAPETVTRLLDMGMDPFNFADALLGVLAQRLVRRLCNWCRTSRDATPQETEELLADYLHAYGAEHRPNPDDVLAGWRERFGLDGKLMHFHSPGCDRCGGNGLRGRAGIHELMAVSRKVRGLIQTGARAEELQKMALSEGMHTLRQDGIEKVLGGITTIGEVRATSN